MVSDTRRFLLIMLPVAAMAPAVHAATFLAQVKSDLRDYTPGDGVCSWVSSGPPPGEPMKYCSLRAAIMEANATPEKDTIYLIPGETYTLNQPGKNLGAEAGDLNITRPLRIETLSIFPGNAAPAIIDANGIDRVFKIEAGAYNVEFVRLGITGGYNHEISSGVAASGDVTFEYVNIFGNTDPEPVYKSAALGCGGGGKIDIKDSAIRDNNSGGVSCPEVTLTRSTISGNTGNAGISAAKLTMVNSTVSGNSNRGVNQYTANSQITIANSTIANNGSAGIWMEVLGNNTAILLINSILSGNGMSCDFGASLSATMRNNLYDDSSCPSDGVDDLSMYNTPANLSPLSYHGGPTQTHRPHTNSYAIDHADSLFCSPLNTDQRGELRPADFTGQNPARCDIGAVELESDVIFWDDFEQPL